MKRFNFYNAIFVSSSLLVILIIIAEFSNMFKTFLASIFSHHWIGKLIIITVAFVIVGFSCKKDKLFGVLDEKIAWYGILASILIILVFFIIHYLA